jgi:hypothetical protein
MLRLPNIFSDRQFRVVAIAVAIVILVIITINIFVIGGDLFVYTFNSSLNSPLSIFIAAFAASIWRLMGAEKHNRLLWSGMLIGWGLWALAETMWAVYSILGQEVPYPSLADFFWVIGYFPMGIGLITRIRTMPAKPNRSQNMLIFGVSISTILVTLILIFIPIFQSFDPQLVVESILNIIYPLADLFLVIVVWRLFFTYEEGSYGFSWRLLIIGFIFMTVSDFIFTYAVWQGIYYPDMKANLISTLAIDVPYTVSYLIWFIGIYALRILLKEEHPIEPGARVRMVRTYGHILVYIKNDGTVIDISPNFNRFFEADNVKGKSLAEALTISEQDGHAVLEKLRSEGKVSDLPIQIRNRSGAWQEISLTGLAVYGYQKEFLGGNLLLRMRVADTWFDDDLHQESRLITGYLLEKSASSFKTEIGQFLSDYYLSYIKSLLDMAFHQGGAVISQALIDQLQETANKRNWQMQFNQRTVLDNTNYSLEVLREALPVLFDTAKRFVSEIVDPVLVEARMREVSSQFSDTVHRDVARYGKAESEVGFSDHRQEALAEKR